jgi:hypothetical protein
VSAGIGLIGLAWSIFKTAGTEGDICSGGECTIGYVYARPLGILGAAGFLVGLRLVRSPDR